MRNSPGQTHLSALRRTVAPVTPEERERALARAAEVGAAQAGRELDIAPGTIRVWRSRAAARAENGGRLETPGDLSGVDPADTWTAAQEALAQFRELIAAGKTLEAQRAAISLGVLIDKSRILEERAAIAHERAVVLADDQAKMVVQMIRTALRALGLPMGEAVTAVLKSLLLQVGEGSEHLTVPPELAEAARAELTHEVWGYDPQAAGPSRTIDTHSHRLKRKLQRAGAQELVQNVRGVGWRLTR
jgi:transposase-like protein